MKNIILVLCLAVCLAVAKGQVNPLSLQATYTEILTKFERPWVNLDLPVPKYPAVYDSWLENIISSIERTKAELDRLEREYELQKNCVDNKRSRLPNTETVRKIAKNCWKQLVTNLTPFAKNLLTYVKSMKQFWTDYYETESKNCAIQHKRRTPYYTTCLDVVATNTEYTIKRYKKELEAMTNEAKPLVMDAYPACRRDPTETKNSD